MSIAIASDYKRFPNAVVDTTHCHESWIEMAKLMKVKGVKNYLFHLTTLQPELVGVDPFDENNSNAIKAKIALECKSNLWYFARKVARLPTQGSSTPSPIRLNRMTLCGWWCLIMNIDVALVAPRQSGKSICFDVDTLRTIHISGDNQDMILLTKDAKLRKINVNRIKKMRDLLPGYLQFHDGNDADNAEELTCNYLGNRLVTGVAQKSKDLADNVARGMTASLLRIDEIGYIFNIDISYQVAASAGTEARDIARRNKTPYSTGVSTTAAKRDTTHGKFAFNLISGGFFWDENIVDVANRGEAIDMITTNASGDNPIVNGTFSHRQLGRTDSFLKDAIVKANGTREAIMKDFLNYWPSGSDSNPLDESVLASIKNSQVDPKHVARAKRKFRLNWYIPKERIESHMNSRHTTIAIDTSNAVGADANGMIITDNRTMETLATSNINVAILTEYALWVAELLIEYPKLTCIIENKSSGMAIMDIIAAKLIEAGMCPFRRMFNRIVNEPVKYNKEYKEICAHRGSPSLNLYETYKKYFGFMTTGRTREFLYNTVIHASANSVGHLVRDATMVGQLLALVEKNGRIDHAPGGHDDLVIAWLLANYFAGYAKNTIFYGVPPNTMLADVSQMGSLLSEEQLIVKRRDAALRIKINRTKEELQDATSSFQRSMIEMRLRTLVEGLTEESEDLNIETLINEVANKGKRSLSEAVKRRKSMNNNIYRTRIAA